MYYNTPQRTVRRFLWLPLQLQGDTRWLTHALVTEHLATVDTGSTTFGAWTPTSFANPGAPTGETDETG